MNELILYVRLINIYSVSYNIVNNFPCPSLGRAFFTTVGCPTNTQICLANGHLTRQHLVRHSATVVNILALIQPEFT